MNMYFDNGSAMYLRDLATWLPESFMDYGVRWGVDSYHLLHVIVKENGWTEDIVFKGDGIINIVLSYMDEIKADVSVDDHGYYFNKDFIKDLMNAMRPMSASFMGNNLEELRRQFSNGYWSEI